METETCSLVGWPKQCDFFLSLLLSPLPRKTEKLLINAPVYSIAAMCSQSAIFCFKERSVMLCPLGLLCTLGLLCQEVKLQECRVCKSLLYQLQALTGELQGMTGQLQGVAGLVSDLKLFIQWHPAWLHQTYH